MRVLSIYFLMCSVLLSCIPKNIEVQEPIRIEEGERKAIKKASYVFNKIDGDALGVREYTLKNG